MLWVACFFEFFFLFFSHIVFLLARIAKSRIALEKLVYRDQVSVAGGACFRDQASVAGEACSRDQVWANCLFAVVTVFECMFLL
jgi:hypothetical protein